MNRSSALILPALLVACSASTPEERAASDAINAAEAGVRQAFEGQDVAFHNVYYVAEREAVCGQVMLGSGPPISGLRWFAVSASGAAPIISNSFNDDTVNELFAFIGCPAVPGPGK